MWLSSSPVPGIPAARRPALASAIAVGSPDATAERGLANINIRVHAYRILLALLLALPRAAAAAPPAARPFCASRLTSSRFTASPLHTRRSLPLLFFAGGTAASCCLLALLLSLAPSPPLLPTLLSTPFRLTPFRLLFDSARHPLPAMRRGLVLFLLANLIIIGVLVNYVFTLITLLFEDCSADAINVAELPPLNSTLIDPRPQLIPKIIHQTYVNDSIPAIWQPAQQSCIDLHPDYEYMVGGPCVAA